MSVFRQQGNFIFLFSTFQMNVSDNYTFFLHLKVDHVNILCHLDSHHSNPVLMLLSDAK